MASNVKNQDSQNVDFALGKQNYYLLIVGFVIIVIGFLLMVGGKA
jgi:uncharacterized integral membrane protein